MCNLIHEEIISHPITGSQEDQVRSFLPSLPDPLIDETISTWAPKVYKESDVAPSTIAEEEEKEEEEQEEPSLPRYRTLPTLPPDQ